MSYSKPYAGLGGPFTTNLSTTETHNVLSVSAQTVASYLGRSLRQAYVPSNSKLQLILDASV